MVTTLDIQDSFNDDDDDVWEHFKLSNCPANDWQTDNTDAAAAGDEEA